MEIIVKLDKESASLLMQLAESISLLASATGFRNGEAPLEIKAVSIKEEEVEEKIIEEPVKVEAPKQKAIKLSEVRNALAKLTKAGRAEEAKALIESFGAEKLTDVPEENYKELLAKAEELS